MTRVDENVPSPRHHDARHEKQWCGIRSKPRITECARLRLVLLPVSRKLRKPYASPANRARHVDLEELIGFRQVSRGEALMHESLEQRGRGIGRAVHDRSAGAMPARRRAQTARSS